jgi:cold shock protein
VGERFARRNILGGIDNSCEPVTIGARVSFKELTMAEGTIKRLTDKGFGFISNESGSDLFFHMSTVEGVRFEDLREGQKVTFNEGRGPKGPRAENVRPI